MEDPDLSQWRQNELKSLEEAKNGILRMHRENKYRVRIEKDLKLIDEHNNKGKKK